MQRRFAIFCVLSFGLVFGAGISCGGEAILSNLGNTGSSSNSGSSGPSTNTNPSVASVEIQNCPSTLPVGTQQAISAVAKDANGNILSSPITYQSTQAFIAQVLNSLLQGKYPGKTALTASSGGVTSAPCDVTVTPPSNSKTVVQYSNNFDDDTWGQNNNESTVSRGRILWKHLNQNGDSEVMLGDSQGNQSLLKTVPGSDVDFMALGSGASANDILSSWREDLSTTFVSSGAGAPASLGMNNQEENNIADGCLFFRKGLPDNDILRFDFTNGLQLVRMAGDLFNPITSGCQAVYELQQNGASTLIYFDGMNETPIVSGLPLFPRFDFRDGRIVYANGGDVFLYDTTAGNPQNVNITNNAGAMNNFPNTDGHSIAFTRNQNNFYDVVLYDIASGTSKVISSTVGPKFGNTLKLDLKQAIWMEGADLYFYDGDTTTLVNLAPATSVNEPHLADGIVAWYGPTGFATDNEIFILK